MGSKLPEIKRSKIDEIKDKQAREMQGNHLKKMHDFAVGGKVGDVSVIDKKYKEDQKRLEATFEQSFNNAAGLPGQAIRAFVPNQNEDALRRMNVEYAWLDELKLSTGERANKETVQNLKKLPVVSETIGFLDTLKNRTKTPFDFMKRQTPEPNITEVGQVLFVPPELIGKELLPTRFLQSGSLTADGLKSSPAEKRAFFWKSVSMLDPVTFGKLSAKYTPEELWGQFAAMDRNSEVKDENIRRYLKMNSGEGSYDPVRDGWIQKKDMGYLLSVNSGTDDFAGAKVVEDAEEKAPVITEEGWRALNSHLTKDEAVAAHDRLNVQIRDLENIIAFNDLTFEEKRQLEELASGRVREDLGLVAHTYDKSRLTDELVQWMRGKLNAEKAEEIGEYIDSLPGALSAAARPLMSGVGGVQNGLTGLRNVPNTVMGKAPVAEGAYDLAAGQIIEDSGGVLKWVNRIPYGIGNAAPAVAAQLALNAALPGSGLAVGAVTMGASASGDGYGDAYRAGKDTGEAQFNGAGNGLTAGGMYYGTGKLMDLFSKSLRNAMDLPPEPVDDLILSQTDDILGGGSNGAGKGIKYKPSSGATLKANSDKTTTILGRYGDDTKAIIGELQIPKSTDFSGNKGGFNLLNTPDELYQSADQFWKNYNKPFIDQAIARGDNIVLATKPRLDKLFLADGKTLTGFGREYYYLIKQGYIFDNTLNMMIKP